MEAPNTVPKCQHHQVIIRCSSRRFTSIKRRIKTIGGAQIPSSRDGRTPGLDANSGGRSVPEEPEDATTRASHECRSDLQLVLLAVDDDSSDLLVHKDEDGAEQSRKSCHR